MNSWPLAVIAFGVTGSLVSCSDTQGDSSSDSTGYGAAAGFAAAGGFTTGTGGAAPAAGGFIATGYGH